MNGYFKQRLFSKSNELEWLDQNQVEIFSDSEDEHYKSFNQKVLRQSYKHECPRCGTMQIVASRFPYCGYCNWDSLIDSLKAKEE